MKAIAVVGLIMMMGSTARATDLTVAAAVTQCFADNEALKAEIAALQEKLKQYEEPVNQEPVPDEPVVQ